LALARFFLSTILAAVPETCCAKKVNYINRMKDAATAYNDDDDV